MAAVIDMYNSSNTTQIFSDPFREELMKALEPFMKSASPTNSASAAASSIYPYSSPSSSFSSYSSYSPITCSEPNFFYPENFCSSSNSYLFSQGLMGFEQPVCSLGLNNLTASQILQINLQQQQQQQQIASLAAKSSVQRNSQINNFLDSKAVPMNYLQPDIEIGKFSQEEEQTILSLHSVHGNSWSAIASQLPGRTDFEIKNFLNRHLKNKLIQTRNDQFIHRPKADIFSNLPHHLASADSKENMGNTNFNRIKVAEGVTPSFIEFEETAPNSDAEGSQSSSFHPYSYKVPLQTTDATSLNSAQASAYGDAELDDSLSWVSFLDGCAETQLFNQSSSSTQLNTLGNIRKQGHETLGEPSTNKLGEQEFGSYLPAQGELQGMTSTQSVDVASESVMDYTDEFTYDKIFKSKEKLIRWTHEVGRNNGFVIVIKRSDSGDGGQKARITFSCERSGYYRNTKKDKEDKKEKQSRNSGTKKCGCPFTLKGHKSDSDKNWTLKVVCGVHNHPVTEPFKRYSYGGRLSKEEILLLKHLSKSMVPPKDILEILKNREGNNALTIKHIYNARQRNKVTETVKKSTMQQLLCKLSEHKYFVWHRNSDNSDIIEDLFWAHPVSIDLLHGFSCVLLLDCTHKTNSCNLSLLEIMGVTSTKMTFAIAFAYLKSEQEDNYTWALERLRSVMDDNALPVVILSDKELALMNAIERVFPIAKHLLCRWRINRNVLTNCKNFFAISEMWEKFRLSWELVVSSSNEDEFAKHLNTLKQKFSTYPQAIEYVTNKWLNNYKERFVSAWTDKIMHFGNLEIKRVESSHSRLKEQLCSNQGNFETSWCNIHKLLEQQHRDIRASFKESSTVVHNRFKRFEFVELRGFISIDALHMVYSESERANSIGVDDSKCGCIIRHTHGLPCAHEIAEFKRESRPIPLESIDLYWRKLDLVHVSKKQMAKLDYEQVSNLTARCFDEINDDTKLTEISSPQSTSLMEPEAKKEIHGQPNSKGQVKKSRRSKGKVYKSKRLKSNTFVSFFPVGLQPYIDDIKDVAADGNCGFRAIADLMGFGENEWLRVKKDLLKELNSNSVLYGLLYGTDGTNERVKELIHALSYFESCPSRDRWMTMPDMGHLIASAYNVALFHLSSQQCLTFLPLRSSPMPADSRKDIAIGFVNKDHFVEVFLSSDHPVPPVASNWYKFRHSCATEWETAYASRIQKFKEIIGDDVATNEIIIDSD